MAGHEEILQGAAGRCEPAGAGSLPPRVFTTSGNYAGNPGSSENTFASFQSGGAGLLESWGGATGSDLISDALGYSVYNQSAVYFIDDSGNGHVLVLGGARRDMEGTPSSGVVFY